MELHQLRSVVAVAETGNFSRAAERCNITQPSLSQQLKNLESELGHKLFHRLGRKSVLTEAGQVFLERARSILFEVENAAKELRNNPNLERTIVVGASPTLAPYVFPRAIVRARQQFPTLQVNTREDFRSGLVQGVVEGVLDLAVVSLPVRDARIHVEPLLDEKLLLVVGRQHPLASKATVSISDLAEEPFILLGGSHNLTSQLHRFFGDVQINPKISHHCAQIRTLKALVAIGAGISILPNVAREPGDSKELAYKTLAGHSPTRELALIRHTLRFQSRGSQQFISVLREVLAEEVED